MQLSKSQKGNGTSPKAKNNLLITLSIKDAAQALNVSRPTIYKLIQNGELNTFTIGRRRLVTPEALNKFIKAREHAA